MKYTAIYCDFTLQCVSIKVRKIDADALTALNFTFQCVSIKVSR